MYRLFILLLLLPFAVNAQSNGFSRGLKSSLGVGAALGQQTPGGVAAFETGYQFSGLYAGAGVGYDGYLVPSYPLFLSLRYSLNSMPGVFVYGQGGISIPTDRKNGEREIPYSVYTRRTAGLFTDIGIAFRVDASTRNSFFLTAGYSNKELEEKRSWTYPCGIVACSTLMTDVTQKNYKMGRLVARLVFEFNW